MKKTSTVKTAMAAKEEQEMIKDIAGQMDYDDQKDFMRNYSQKMFVHEEAEILEIEVSLFEARKIFIRLMTIVHEMALYSSEYRTKNPEALPFDLCDNLVRSHLDYAYELAARIVKKREVPSDL